MGLHAQDKHPAPHRLTGRTAAWPRPLSGPTGSPTPVLSTITMPIAPQKGDMRFRTFFCRNGRRTRNRLSHLLLRQFCAGPLFSGRGLGVRDDRLLRRRVPRPTPSKPASRKARRRRATWVVTVRRFTPSTSAIAVCERPSSSSSQIRRRAAGCRPTSSRTAAASAIENTMIPRRLSRCIFTLLRARIPACGTAAGLLQRARPPALRGGRPDPPRSAGPHTATYPRLSARTQLFAGKQLTEGTGKSLAIKGATGQPLRACPT